MLVICFHRLLVSVHFCVIANISFKGLMLVEISISLKIYELMFVLHKCTYIVRTVNNESIVINLYSLVLSNVIEWISKMKVIQCNCLLLLNLVDLVPIPQQSSNEG